MNAKSPWKIFLSRILSIGVLVILIPVIIQAVRIIWFAGKIHKIFYSAQPFTQSNPNAKVKILFVGDSTAVGTGAVDNHESVAGWLGKFYPETHIDNLGKNGFKLSDLAAYFQPSLTITNHYKFVIVQIGGNDILRFTNLKNVERDLAVIINRAKTVGRHVIVLHSGNVGLAPIFIWPFDWIMTKHTRVFRELYMRKAKENGAIYIDLFTERENDPFFSKADEPNFYSADYLHPSGVGYARWYSKLRQTLDIEHLPFD